MLEAPSRSDALPGQTDPPEGPGPSGRITVPVADGFRGLAAMAVLSYHVIYAAGLPRLHNGAVRDVLMSGYMGVDFFLVLSGFLLFLPVVAAKGAFGDVRAYAVRRAARILPAYYVALAGTVGLLAFLTATHVKLSPNFSHDLPLNLVLHMTFLQHTFGTSFGIAEGFGINGALWTLSLEALFYVCLPFVAARFFRRPFVGLAAAVVLAAGWRLAAAHLLFPLPPWPALKSPPLARLILITQFPTYLAHFAFGMTAAWLFVKLIRRRTALRGWFVVAIQVVALAGVLWGMQAAGRRDLSASAGPLAHWSSTTPVAICFAVLLLATALAPGWAQFVVRNRVVRRLGDISYGVYLWHLLFVVFALMTLHFRPAATTAAFVKMYAFVLTGALLAGWASFRWIEQPVMRWARRFRR